MKQTKVEFSTTTKKKTFILNGTTYNSLEELPEEYQETLRKSLEGQDGLSQTDVTTSQTNYTVNGQSYTPDNLPQKYAHLAEDKDGNGIPDIVDEHLNGTSKNFVYKKPELETKALVAKKTVPKAIIIGVTIFIALTVLMLST